ncbi:hypothetical protein GOP47_0025752 [Adiantum capillus-veneris]|uniref:Endopeptidase S2P n=1 Tax=Adiantum capillus-veneris TaxID=13818 RepID=A0A9D4U1T8_ADICA|nr:hypothetical protein GOP47_0025752 [Adiantum capillus-veneris]
MVMMLFLMLFWVASLLTGLWSWETADESTQVSGQVLTLVIPGVNMPWSDLPYMIVAITISVGFHEVGHAIAAASEGVPIEHIAVFLACLVPGALVALNQDSLQLLSPIRALRIYCAGIWHNMMCCAGCYVFLLLFQVVFSPSDAGKHFAVVSKIDGDSPLAGHLQPGDYILSVGGLQVQTPEEFFEFLHTHNKGELAKINYTSFANVTAEEPHKSIKYIASQGFCVSPMKIQEHGNRMPGSLCSNDALLFYQHSCSSAGPSSVHISENVLCFKAVDVVECPQCSIKQDTSQSCSCPVSTSCLLPLLSSGEAFIGMRIKQSSVKHCRDAPNDPICERNLVFVGDVRVFSNSLQLTNYWPQQIGDFGFCFMLFRHLESLLTYTFSLSAAMALLNSALVFYLDGEQIFQAGLVLNKSWVPPKRHAKIMRTVLTLGTILMAFMLISSFVHFILDRI